MAGLCRRVSAALNYVILQDRGWIIMYYAADIRRRPGPQRVMLMIGTRFAQRALSFFVLKKKHFFPPHISPQTLSFSKTHEILEFAFMWSILRRFLRLAFNSCICCLSLSNGYFSRSDLPVNHYYLSVFLTRTYSAAVTMCCTCVCSNQQRVQMCVFACMPGILYVLICHFYKITSGADFLQRMSTSCLTEPAEFLFLWHLFLLHSPLCYQITLIDPNLTH